MYCRVHGMIQTDCQDMLNLDSDNCKCQENNSGKFYTVAMQAMFMGRVRGQ